MVRQVSLVECRSLWVCVRESVCVSGWVDVYVYKIGIYVYNIYIYYGDFCKYMLLSRMYIYMIRII